MLHRVMVCKMFEFLYKLLYVYFPEKLLLTVSILCIKGERKEGDWSVAKNLLKPTDGGKVKVTPPDFIHNGLLSLITIAHCHISYIL